jgi:hypothetical protein
MRRLLALTALALVMLLIPPSAFSQAGAKYPKPDNFKIDAPHAMGKVGLNDTLFDGAVEWSGQPKCKFKEKNSKCTWGKPKAPHGFASMQASGDENSKLIRIGIFLGVKDNGQVIQSNTSPLLDFRTTRGKVGLMSPSSKVPDIDPDIEEFSGGYLLRGKGDAVMFFFTGGPNDKFVTGIVLSNLGV